MITIKNAKSLDGQIRTFTLPSEKDELIDAEKRLLFFPGIIDPHICFGSPKSPEWKTAVQVAIEGGITAAIDIPTLSHPCNTKESLASKKQLVEQELSKLQMPLNFFFYASADPATVDQLGLTKKLLNGIIILSNFHQLKKDDEHWNRLFQLAAWEDLPILINANNETSLNSSNAQQIAVLEQAIFYAEKQNTRLYILNVSTQAELDLIKKGRERALLLYAETTPLHLFGRQSADRDALWEALRQGTIETIGSGYFAEDQEKDKIIFQNKEFNRTHPLFFLPQLLTAVQEGQISIEKVGRLIHHHIHDILDIPITKDAVLIDLEQEYSIQLKTGEEIAEKRLKGWPAYTILQGQVFKSSLIIRAKGH